jgi:hypothetical protein
VDWSDVSEDGQELMALSCELDSDISVPVRGGEFLDY